MIKGINHQVIEITETNNMYYERALLVVRPEYTQVQREILEKEAKKLLGEVNRPSIMKKKAFSIKSFVRAGAGIALGSIVTLIIQWLIF